MKINIIDEHTFKFVLDTDKQEHQFTCGCVNFDEAKKLFVNNFYNLLESEIKNMEREFYKYYSEKQK